MIKTYIYPTYTPSRDKSGNLYIKYFHEAFERNESYKVVNHFWQIGITSLLFNLDAKLIIIQWVDLIPGKRFGKIQFIFFLFTILIAHILGRKIVWLMHNKHAHNGKSHLVSIGMKFMARMSTSVFAHSKDGIDFFDKMYPDYAGKCHYIPHPVYSQEIYETGEEKYDFIIWGGIGKRKRIVEFLDACNKNPDLYKKKILICGYCGDKSYTEQIESKLTENISFINKFHSDEELRTMISQSKSILFTYDSSSMLSSGALIYSLNFNKPVVGPNAGNFKDLEGIVTCYNSFDEIPTLNPTISDSYLQDYLNENTWNKLPSKVQSIIPN